MPSSNENLIEVHITTHAQQVEVTPVRENVFRVRLTAAPDRGAANEQLIEALASYFEVHERRIKIVRGHASHTKWVQIG